ncbi:MAG TPA: hypothetical protein EYP98_08155 [Planctomycetes bacterium]|nr:hypothetical protein [Planctomycetota bacterium]
MSPHQESIQLEPTELKALAAAFDQAWVNLAADVSADPQTLAQARTKLALIMLELAKLGDGSGQEELCRRGIRIFRGMP